MLNPLTLIHKDLIQNKLKELQLPFADLAFGNLYLWREKRRNCLVDFNGLVGIQSFSRDQKQHLIPLDPIPQHLKAYETILENNRHLHLYPLPQEWADLFSEELYHKETNPSWDDYIYQTIKIGDYGGRSLDGPRNHVKHFIQENEFEVHLFEKRWVAEGLKVLNRWKSSHLEEDDYEVCSTALREFEEIGLSGVIVISQGEALGFTLGESLNQTMFDVQFAKADIAFRGIYPFLFQSLAKNIPHEWLNYEFDLGIPGLRKNKLGYAPDHFAIKWRVRRR